MRISHIAPNTQYNSLRRPNNNNINFAGKGNTLRRIGALGAAAVLTTSMAACGPKTTAPQDTAAYVLTLNQLELPNLPVSEFYFTNAPRTEKITPNKEIKTNNNGSIIVTITPKATEETNTGATLKEIIEEVYADALANYDSKEKISIFNKIVDETVQANPSLSEFIKKELGEEAKSYNDIAELNLHEGKSSKGEAIDTRLLTMPTVVVYQAQGEDTDNIDYIYTMEMIEPAHEFASVLPGEKNLEEQEFNSLSELIYSEYGKDIENDTYRDILYAIVNAPKNAEKFEITLDKMTLNEIIETKNINDINRTLKDNISGKLTNLYLPTVSALRTQAKNAEIKDGSKNGIIFQISPAAARANQDDRVIQLVDNKNQNLSMITGDVFTLKDVLQFYSSPNGEGRFAKVKDGGLEFNFDIDYFEEFSTNILQQVVFANLDIFTTEYKDGNETYKYGVFDVNEGYDTKGKSLEEIIKNSTINLNRMINYTFINEKGESRFVDGVELTLPQFNYRINKCGEDKEADTQAPIQEEDTTPVWSNPPKPTPSTPTKPGQTDPTTDPTPTNPTKPAPTTPTKPTPTTPTKPTPTEPSCEPPIPDDYEDEDEPTIPSTTKPSTKPNPGADDISPVEPSTKPNPGTTAPTTKPGADDIAPVDPTKPTKPTTKPSTTTPCDDSVNDDYVDEEDPTL